MHFSIITCTYNVEKTLAKTLDSVLLQNFNDYEIIIIDGKSTDKTLEIVKEYEKKFNGKLKWIVEKEKSGIYVAMNKGIKMAKGEFIGFLNAGDWFELEILKRIAENIKNNSNLEVFYGKTQIWSDDLKKLEILQTLPEILLKQTLQHNALFYKKKLHEKFGFYAENYKICADYDFCLKAFYLGKVKVFPLDFITTNFVKDGISSKRKFRCLYENALIRQKLSLSNLPKEFFIQLKNKIVRTICQK